MPVDVSFATTSISIGFEKLAHFSALTQSKSIDIARAAAQLRFYASVAVEGSYLGLTVDSATSTGPALVPDATSPSGRSRSSARATSRSASACWQRHRLGARRRVPGRGEGAPGASGASLRSRELATTHSRPPAPRTAPSASSPVSRRATRWCGAGDLRGRLHRLPSRRPRAVAAGERPAVAIPVYAEMGTVNPAVMTPAAANRLDEIATGFVGSFTLGSGQFCTKPGMLLRRPARVCRRRSPGPPRRRRRRR